MRSPFLQTIYFEYYVSSTTIAPPTAQSKEENVFGFLVFPTLGSGIDHISVVMRTELDQQCWQLEDTNFYSLRGVVKQKKKEEIQR